jgi:hypothetical protein
MKSPYLFNLEYSIKQEERWGFPLLGKKVKFYFSIEIMFNIRQYSNVYQYYQIENKNIEQVFTDIPEAVKGLIR